ncbi:hypothetical protein [Nonomuraea sp. NPDC005650]|uniref:hypothetical protein n=1 Tax=Nonomuraea sp. NPDC005650 TaxID=3157045 RepID=UPI0033A58D46
MDSHGSASPTSPPDAGAMSRPADADVTRRRPAVEIPGFRNVSQQGDGTWTAVHVASGEPISAPTLERLETIEAPIVRLTHGWRGVS